MRLGIDIDECVVHLLPDFLCYYNERNNTSFTQDDFTSYRWWETLGISKSRAYRAAQAFSVWCRPDEGYGPQPLRYVEHVIPALELLHYHRELFFITDRTPHFDWNTFELQCALVIEEGPHQCFPQFGKGRDVELMRDDNLLQCRQLGLSKAEVCVQYNIRELIEDNPDNIKAAAQAGIDCYVLSRPWNRHLPAHPHIHRCNGWQDITTALVGQYRLE